MEFNVLNRPSLSISRNRLTVCTIWYAWNICVTIDRGYVPRKHFPVLSSFMSYHRICKQINTTGATNGAGTAYPSGEPVFTPRFQWGSCYPIFSFIRMFCRSLLVLLYFFFWTLCCLFFFDIRILITPLVSSNSKVTISRYLAMLEINYRS